MYIINLDLTLVRFICSVYYYGCGSLIGFFLSQCSCHAIVLLELFALPVTGCLSAR